MMTRRPTLFFASVKERREGYFVEYSPPGGDIKFATLSLVFHQGADPTRAAQWMESEARHWLDKYPIPIMVFAYDEKGDTIEIAASLKGNCLIAWQDRGGLQTIEWGLVEDEKLPPDALSAEYLLDVYGELEYRTADEVKRDAYARARTLAKDRKIGFAIILGWGVIVPAGIALVGWANPVVGAIAVLYALYKAARQAALMLGWICPSEREKADREKERLMGHYYYHCQRNPDGFRRLVCETFEQDERESVRKEAESLRHS